MQNRQEILIFTNKHGKYAFICNNFEEKCKVALRMLKIQLWRGEFQDEERDLVAELVESPGVNGPLLFFSMRPEFEILIPQI